MIQKGDSIASMCVGPEMIDLFMRLVVNMLLVLEVDQHWFIFDGTVVNIFPVKIDEKMKKYIEILIYIYIYMVCAVFPMITNCIRTLTEYKDDISTVYSVGNLVEIGWSYDHRFTLLKHFSQ